MSRALLASLRGILCHITNNQPLNEVITAIQENNYEVVQFQGRKIQIKELTKKHLHHFDFARLSPPVHPGPWRPIMSLRHSALSKKRREARLGFFLLPLLVREIWRLSVNHEPKNVIKNCRLAAPWPHSATFSASDWRPERFSSQARIV